MNFVLFDCSSQPNQSSFDVNPSRSVRLQTQQPSPQYTDNNRQSANQQNANFIPFVTINHNKQLLLSQEAIKILRDQLQQSFSFVAVISKSQDDRAVDKKYQKNDVYSIKMQKRARHSRSQHKVFLLKLLIHAQNDYNHQKTERLLKILMVLSSTLVIFVRKVSELSLIGHNLSSVYKGENSDFWPRKVVIPHLQLDALSSKQINALQLMFYEIKQDKYLSLDIENQLQKISYQTQAKKYKRLTVSGSIFYSIILKYCYSLNNSTGNTADISMSQLFQPIIQELYHSNYLYLTNQYDNKLKAFFSQEKPLRLDELLLIFSQMNVQIFERLPLNLQNQLEQKYKKELEEYVDQKERLIIQVNKKKCQFYNKKMEERFIQTLPKQNQMQQFKDFYQRFSIQWLNTQHGSINIIGRCLSKLFLVVNRNERNRKKQFSKYQKKMKERQQELKTAIQEGQLQYLRLKEARERNTLILAERQKQRNRLVETQAILRNKIGKIKSEKKQIKHDKAEDLQQKLKFQEKIMKLVQKLKDLEYQERQNVFNLQEARNEAPYKNKIERLNRKLSEIQFKCQVLEGKRSRVSSSDNQKRLNQQNEVNITFFQK